MSDIILTGWDVLDEARAMLRAAAAGAGAGDDEAADLLRYLGRRPDWTAA
jgi:hypothetical protein